MVAAVKLLGDMLSILMRHESMFPPSWRLVTLMKLLTGWVELGMSRVRLKGLLLGKMNRYVPTWVPPATDAATSVLVVSLG